MMQLKCILLPCPGRPKGQPLQATLEAEASLQCSAIQGLYKQMALSSCTMGTQIMLLSSCAALFGHAEACWHVPTTVRNTCFCPSCAAISMTSWAATDVLIHGVLWG